MFEFSSFCFILWNFASDILEFDSSSRINMKQLIITKLRAILFEVSPYFLNKLLIEIVNILIYFYMATKNFVVFLE